MKKKSMVSLTLFLTTSVCFAQDVAAPAAVEPTVKADDKKTDTGAKPLALKISGNITALAAGVSQRIELNGKSGTASIQVPVSDLNFEVKGRTAGGIEYGYLTRFSAISEAFAVTRNYGEVKGNFGIIQLGNVKGPDDTYGTYGAYGLLGATGGINGSVYNFFNPSEGVIQGTTIIGSPGVATKVVYYTPELKGWKFGVSFTPDTSHRGKQNRDNSRTTTSTDGGNETAIYPNATRYGWGVNNWTFALSYNGDWGDSKLNLNFVTIREQGRFVFLEMFNAIGNGTAGTRTPYSLQKTDSYMVSAQYTYKDFDIAASFLDNQKSRLPGLAAEMYAQSNTVIDALGSITPIKSINYFPYGVDGAFVSQGNAGKAWNIGGRYTFGAYQAAVGYFGTRRKTDANGVATADAVTTTLDFKAIDGFVIFGEATAIRTATNKNALASSNQYGSNSTGGADSPIKNNSGAVFMAGTKISF